MKKFIKQDCIAFDDCSFCGTHENCGHYFRAIKIIWGGCEEERDYYILVNTCGDYSWICKYCWEKIKKALM